MQATQPTPLIENISDTARWAAVYRARESERPDALFRDPYARRLAGERGEEIARAIPFSERATWAWVTRTYLFNQFILEQLELGVDMVVNLAAGLDARPYYLSLPPSLHWVEVDLPGILEYKESILAADQPRCRLERLHLDLSDLPARRVLFERLGKQSNRALILSEGLLIYFAPEHVGDLARDLATPASFQHWILDLASPGLVKMLQKNMGRQLGNAGALKFGPSEGPAFFEKYGWKAADVRSPLKTAARFKRLTFGMRLAALFPASNGAQGRRPWSGICLMARQ
jgi:methyltransferase (TIGR00027 family)